MVNVSKEFPEQIQEIQERPLSSSEQERLEKYVKNYSFSIKKRLQSKHFISTYGDLNFSIREIFNHSEIIEKALRESGYNFSLSSFTFTRGQHKYYALVDYAYYKGKPHLYDDLANSILDQE